MEIIKSLNLIDNAGLTILILVCSMGFTALTKEEAKMIGDLDRDLKKNKAKSKTKPIKK